MNHYFIGVDGGATKTVVRLEDEAGRVLGTVRGGPANIRISIKQAWQSINEAIDILLDSLSIKQAPKKIKLHAGIGIAGCEVKSQYQAFINVPHRFETVLVTSDAHTACLGAHGGGDGAIIIAGTGTIGFESHRDHSKQIGGWGFPVDDEGSGAWLGLKAVSATLKWLDGRLMPSALATAVYAHFHEDFSRMVAFANTANSTAFAELAPLVIQCAHAKDQTAIELLQQAANAIKQIAAILSAQLPCAFIGGLAAFLEPYLDPSLANKFRPCLLPPEAGAIFLIRHYLKKGIKLHE